MARMTREQQLVAERVSRTIERLTTILRLYSALCGEIQSMSAVGWPARTPLNGEPGGGGGIGDPTATAALHPDDVADDWLSFAGLVDIVDHRTSLLVDLTARYMAIVEQRPGLTPEARGVQRCRQGGCPTGAYATRSGRCDACYAYRDRHGYDRTVAT